MKAEAEGRPEPDVFHGAHMSEHKYHISVTMTMIEAV